MIYKNCIRDLYKMTRLLVCPEAVHDFFFAFFNLIRILTIRRDALMSFYMTLVPKDILETPLVLLCVSSVPPPNAPCSEQLCEDKQLFI